MKNVPLALRMLRAYCHHSPVGRGRSRLVHWAYQNLHIPDISVDVFLDETIPIRLRIKIWVDFNIYCIGLYEHYLAEFFKRQLQADTVFLDVGAYIGQYALLAAHAAPRGSVFAFEPNADSAQRLRTTTARNRLDNLTVVEAAVGQQATGLVRFYLTEQPFQSSLVAGHETFHSITEVPTISLDVFSRRHNLTQIDIIKIDVEEAENEVILGGLQVIERYRPLLIIEIGRRSLREGVPLSVSLLQDIGYRFFTIDHNRLVPLGTRLEPNMDVVAVHRSTTSV